MNARIARRYAKALYKICGENLDRSKEALESLHVLMGLFDDKDAGKILRSPVMPADLKQTLLHYALEKASSTQDLTRLIDGMVHASRVALIPEMIGAFIELIQEVEGYAQVELTSAVPLDAAQQEAISQEIGRLVGKKLTVESTINPDLLGGFVAKVGNYRLDMSLKTKLDGLTQSAIQDTIL